jgi:hypothetical protein
MKINKLMLAMIITILIVVTVIFMDFLKSTKIDFSVENIQSVNIFYGSSGSSFEHNITVSNEDVKLDSTLYQGANQSKDTFDIGTKELNKLLDIFKKCNINKWDKLDNVTSEGSIVFSIDINTNSKKDFKMTVELNAMEEDLKVFYEDILNYFGKYELKY